MERLLSSSVAPAAFGTALLCAGQLSTFTGTIAGQVRMGRGKRFEQGSLRPGSGVGCGVGGWETRPAGRGGGGCFGRGTREPTSFAARRPPLRPTYQPSPSTRPGRLRAAAQGCLRPPSATVGNCCFARVTPNPQSPPTRPPQTAGRAPRLPQRPRVDPHAPPADADGRDRARRGAAGVAGRQGHVQVGPRADTHTPPPPAPSPARDSGTRHACGTGFDHPAAAPAPHADKPAHKPANN